MAKKQQKLLHRVMFILIDIDQRVISNEVYKHPYIVVNFVAQAKMTTCFPGKIGKQIHTYRKTYDYQSVQVK
jgi:hypothetical protein